ncbi:MAG: alpha/beta hydrolase [Pacificimonas sp.]
MSASTAPIEASHDLLSARRRRLPDGGETIWLQAEDGARLRLMRWAGPDSGSCHVILTGGKRDFIERHAESVHRLLAAGHGVTMFDWRDQGLSARGSVPDDRLFDYMEGDVAAVLTSTVSDIGGPVAMAAHSMGGHMALRLLAQRPELRQHVARLVLFAPMLGLARNIPGWLLSGVSRWHVARGRHRENAPGQPEYGPVYKSGERQRLLTGDAARFAESFDWIDREPGLAAGGATWGWILSAQRSMALLRRPGTLENISTPTLVFAGTKEKVVSNAAIEAAVARLSGARLVVIPNGHHELQLDTDEVQAQLWSETLAFLAE